VVLCVWAPQCMDDLEICMHVCIPIILISTYGCTLREDKGMHGMHTYFLHSCAWVRNYAVDRCVVMCTCVCDRGAWRRLCMAGRRAFMHAYGMNRHACVCACGVNKNACVRAYGFKQPRLGGKADGCKTYLFWKF